MSALVCREKPEVNSKVNLGYPAQSSDGESYELFVLLIDFYLKTLTSERASQLSIAVSRSAPYLMKKVEISGSLLTSIFEVRLRPIRPTFQGGDRCVQYLVKVETVGGAK